MKLLFVFTSVLSSVAFAFLLPVATFANSSFTVNVDSQMEVRGYEDTSHVEKRIESHLYSIKNCYLEVFKNDPSFKKVNSTLRFGINSEGVTQNISVKSSSKKAQTMDSCIASKVKEWTFPKPEKESAGADVKLDFKGENKPATP